MSKANEAIATIEISAWADGPGAEGTSVYVEGTRVTPWINSDGIPQVEVDVGSAGEHTAAEARQLATALLNAANAIDAIDAEASA